jgi:hypothetical protein
MALIPDEAVDRMTELSAGAWRLYCYLARCRNQKSGKCNPSVVTSAEAIGVHQKNVFKLRRELVETAWARFDGNDAIFLLGFKGSKNATANDVNDADKADGSKNATSKDVSSKNATIGDDSKGVSASDSENAEGKGQCSKNATIDDALEEDGDKMAESSKNTTNDEESQKRYPMVAKTLPDGSKNATAYKEEPAKEPAKEPANGFGAGAPQTKRRRRSVPSEPAEAKSREADPCYETFCSAFEREYSSPYRSKAADFVQLAALRKTCSGNSWDLTTDRWSKGLGNYFASDLGNHTIADLASRFSAFYRSPLDRFGKPIAAVNGNGMLVDPNTLSPKTRGNAAALQAFIERGKHD